MGPFIKMDLSREVNINSLSLLNYFLFKAGKYAILVICWRKHFFKLWLLFDKWAKLNLRVTNRFKL